MEDELEELKQQVVKLKKDLKYYVGLAARNNLSLALVHTILENDKDEDGELCLGHQYYDYETTTSDLAFKLMAKLETLEKQNQELNRQVFNLSNISHNLFNNND